jgi:hypothetical protein
MFTVALFKAGDTCGCCGAVEQLSGFTNHTHTGEAGCTCG